MRVTTGGTDFHGPVQLAIASKDPFFAEITEMILSLNEAVVEGFSDVYCPKTLKTGSSSVPSTDSLDDFLSDAEEVSIYSVDVSDDIAVVTNELREYLNRDVERIDAPVFISGGRYEDATWSVYLPAGEIEVGPENSEIYRLQKKGDIKSVRSMRAPLELSLRAATNTYAPDGYDKPVIYKLTIMVGADIYVEDSPIGEINRACLHEAIEYIAERFDVVDRSFSYGFTKEPWMREHLFEYDGPSSDELIREYRLNWVQSELVQTVKKYKEDGETIFEVTSDAAAVLTDELRKRIEVFVDHQQAQGNAPQADRLRIVRTDGTSLEATFSDGNVAWADTQSN